MTGKDRNTRLDWSGGGAWIAIEDIKPGMIVGSRIQPHPWKQRVECGVAAVYRDGVSVRFQKIATVNTVYPVGTRLALFDRPLCPHCGGEL